jgi:hypothetical protein
MWRVGRRRRKLIFQFLNKIKILIKKYEKK